jgi:diguanylate cyclase (GGDEF)-like protein/PAS domain S-box-containing protein
MKKGVDRSRNRKGGLMLNLIRKLFRIGASKGTVTDEATHFRMLTEGINDVVFRCGPDGTAFYVSPSSVRLFGWTPAEMVGKGPSDFVVAEDLPAIIEAQKSHAAGEDSSLLAYRVKRKDGTTVWVEGSAHMVVDPAIGGPNLIVVMRDISERKRQEERLYELATTDGLTGLANRRAFDEALETEWRRTQRASGQLSLLLIDLDHFKGFNDHYGHQVGDDCLRTVASTIRASIRRPADLAARYGGEEIAIILPDTDAAGAVFIAQAIRMAVETLLIPHAENAAGAGFVTISTGVATTLSRVGGSIQMPAGLLQAADTALYKAKHNGRNRVETALMISGDGGAVNAGS